MTKVINFKLVRSIKAHKETFLKFQNKKKIKKKIILNFSHRKLASFDVKVTIESIPLYIL
jgi:hypothetical protein